MTAADSQGVLQRDLAILKGELSLVEKSRCESLPSAAESQFDGYRVAYAKAKLMAVFCLDHPEFVASVRDEMDQIREQLGRENR